MARGREEDGQRVTHAHLWGSSFDLTSKKCACGAVLVSAQEYQHRMDAWRNYFEVVLTTPAYLDLCQMRQAFRDHNLKQIREIRARIDKRVTHNPDGLTEAERWVEHYEYMPEPEFPDPETWNRYVVKGSEGSL